jgi:hypothetical protein
MISEKIFGTTSASLFDEVCLKRNTQLNQEQLKFFLSVELSSIIDTVENLLTFIYTGIRNEVAVPLIQMVPCTQLDPTSLKTAEVFQSFKSSLKASTLTPIVFIYQSLGNLIEYFTQKDRLTPTGPNLCNTKP